MYVSQLNNYNGNSSAGVKVHIAVVHVPTLIIVKLNCILLEIKPATVTLTLFLVHGSIML